MGWIKRLFVEDPPSGLGLTLDFKARRLQVEHRVRMEAMRQDVEAWKRQRAKQFADAAIRDSSSTYPRIEDTSLTYAPVYVPTVIELPVPDCAPAVTYDQGATSVTDMAPCDAGSYDAGGSFDGGSSGGGGGGGDY